MNNLVFKELLVSKDILRLLKQQLEMIRRFTDTEKAETYVYSCLRTKKQNYYGR